MPCRSCGATNPAGKKFCADCGVPLDPIDPQLRQAIQTVFREQLRDQKVVEIETAEAVITRLKSWAQPVSIALALVVTVLGFIGFRSFYDAFQGFRTAQAQAIQSLREKGDAEAKSLGLEASALRTQFHKVGDQQELLQRIRDAELQINGILRAGRALKEKYDTAGAELARMRASGPGPSPNIGNERIPRPAARFLTTGSAGKEVGELQTRLRDLGCYRSPTNGEFDAATKSAVERFNQAQGDVFGTGVVDDETWSALFGKSPARCR